MIPEAIDFCRRSASNGFHDRDDFFRRHIRDAVLLVRFGIRLAPAIAGSFFIRFTHEQKILFGSFFSLAAQPRMCGFPQTRRQFRILRLLMMIYFLFLYHHHHILWWHLVPRWHVVLGWHVVPGWH